MYYKFSVSKDIQKDFGFSGIETWNDIIITLKFSI